MFLFLSPCLFASRFAINGSHSAQAFLSVCVGLWQQLPLDRAERITCQGQNCALISVHHRTAGLTPLPFTPEASWHYAWVCVVFSIKFFNALSPRPQRPDIWDCLYINLQTLSRVSLCLIWDGHSLSGKETRVQRGSWYQTWVSH